VAVSIVIIVIIFIIIIIIVTTIIMVVVISPLDPGPSLARHEVGGRQLQQEGAGGGRGQHNRCATGTGTRGPHRYLLRLRTAIARGRAVPAGGRPSDGG
jgi:hypothetical protein